MAAASLDEMTYELWLASGEGGDECLYVRVIRAGEDIRHGGAGHCSFDDPPASSEFQWLGVTTPIGPRNDRYGRHPTIAGRLPIGATQLEITFSNGETHRASAEHGGYFVTILPMGLPDDASVVLLRAVAPDGRTVAVRSISARRHVAGVAAVVELPSGL